MPSMTPTPGQAPDSMHVAAGTSSAALADAAWECARLAIARWRSDAHAPQMPMPVSPQARWYAQASHGFQEWLTLGGFAQPSPAPPQPAGREREPMRCGDTSTVAPVRIG